MKNIVVCALLMMVLAVIVVPALADENNPVPVGTLCANRTINIRDHQSLYFSKILLKLKKGECVRKYEATGRTDWENNGFYSIVLPAGIYGKEGVGYISRQADVSYTPDS